MPQNLEARIAKLELGRRGHRLTHEDWLKRMAGLPPLTEAESATFDARIEAEAVSEFESLKAAAVVANEKASRTHDPMDAILVRDLEVRCEDEDAGLTGVLHEAISDTLRKAAQPSQT